MFASFLAVGWAGYGMLVEYRNGYLDKLRASPDRPLARSWPARWCRSSSRRRVMAGVLLVVSLLLGATLVTGVGGFLLILGAVGALRHRLRRRELHRRRC